VKGKIEDNKTINVTLSFRSDVQGYCLVTSWSMGFCGCRGAFQFRFFPDRLNCPREIRAFAAESWEYEGPSTNLAAPAKDQSMNVYK
jgi:hypothetical protein